LSLELLKVGTHAIIFGRILPSYTRIRCKEKLDVNE
jgi:hypothetical protein